LGLFTFAIENPTNANLSSQGNREQERNKEKKALNPILILELIYFNFRNNLIG